MEDQNQIHDLIDKYLDENLQPQETEHLERLLLKSEAARKAFWELTEIHGLLRETINKLPANQGSEESIIKFKRTNRLLKVYPHSGLYCNWASFSGHMESPKQTRSCTNC